MQIFFQEKFNAGVEVIVVVKLFLADFSRHVVLFCQVQRGRVHVIVWGLGDYDVSRGVFLFDFLLPFFCVVSCLERLAWDDRSWGGRFR